MVVVTGKGAAKNSRMLIAQEKGSTDVLGVTS
jgi:hypothetical protein